MGPGDFRIDPSVIADDAPAASQSAGPRRATVVLGERELLNLLGAKDGESIRSVDACNNPPSVMIVMDSPQLPTSVLGAAAPIVNVVLTAPN